MMISVLMNTEKKNMKDQVFISEKKGCSKLWFQTYSNCRIRLAELMLKGLVYMIQVVLVLHYGNGNGSSVLFLMLSSFSLVRRNCWWLRRMKTRRTSQQQRKKKKKQRKATNLDIQKEKPTHTYDYNTQSSMEKLTRKKKDKEQSIQCR